MSRQQTVSALTAYGFSAFKALEIAIDAERGNSLAKWFCSQAATPKQ